VTAVPDVGVPSPLPTAADPASRSHTATVQWQSFEMRMRERRAHRCRLRAETAIEAGLLDDAREALDEARRLSPLLPGLEETEQKLADAQAPVPEPEPPRSRRGRAVAIAAVLVGAAVAGLLVFGPTEPPPGAGTTTSPPQQRVVANPEVVPTSGPIAANPNPAPPDVPAAAPESTPVVPADAPGEAQTPSKPELVSPLVAAAPVIEVPPPPTRSAPDLLPPVEPPAALPPPVATLPAAPPEPPGRDTATGSRAEARAAGAADTEVRAALSRYEAAYSALDAIAARAIFPSVDAGALGRAFDSLRSQRISLGACDVVISNGGQSAVAQCTGRATWSPRIGGGEHSAERRWTFELERMSSGWQIVKALTR
jgi:hypothetical protein